MTLHMQKESRPAGAGGSWSIKQDKGDWETVKFFSP